MMDEHFMRGWTHSHERLSADLDRGLGWLRAKGSRVAQSIAPAVSGLKTLSVRPRRVSTLCTRPPSNPSTIVEIIQLSAVMPPIE